MNSTLAKTLLLLLLTGLAVAVVCHLSCAPTAAINRLLGEPGIPELDTDEFNMNILRVLAKEQLARELVAGRRSLWETAALFGALDRLPPERPRGLDTLPRPTTFRPHTHEEGLCAQVLHCVAYVTSSAPDREAHLARLEAELREELRRNGAVRLPDPATLTPAEQLINEARAGWRTEHPRIAPSGATRSRP